MVYRTPSAIIKTKSSVERNIRFPLPRHELFINHNTRIPFLNSPIAIVVGSVGCPFKCKFCCVGQFEFRVRDLANLLEEIRYIKGVGINNIFFVDPAFTAHKDNCIRFCKEITELKINWICNSHPACLVDNEFTNLLETAGCRMIMMGVETGSAEMLELYSKSTAIKLIKEAFKVCKINHIHTLAYFIIGFPGETRSSVLKTISFAKELNCDFVSFDFPMPDFGTDLREEMINRNLIPADFLYGWDPSGKPLFPADNLSIRDLIKLRDKAYREFYLRPSYIKNRLFNLNSVQELKSLIKGGMSLFLKR
ncbi:MAG: radical SAM protein [Candidatus Omnitrophota bacterium]